MSKETFSKEINNMMLYKFQILENIVLEEFFKKDKYFELILCLAYMTLSKEKIIKKDMNNPMRLDRLTRLVDEKDIDKVFQEGFCKDMPNIIYAKEYDNTWILDNIRDSIMHGSFDIDEEKECFIIDNTQYDRELKVEIPFTWFIEYAKYDIFSKKLTDKYTIRGFYYNNDKKDYSYIRTRNEINNSILYNVHITGNKFNIKNMEKRVNEIFEECSKAVLDEFIIEKYRKRIDLEKIKYDEKYLVSFYIASDTVKEKIEKEFPGTNVNIYINNRRYKLVNKISKKISKYYNNYDLFFEQLNNCIKSKGISLINYISNIIDNVNNNINFNVDIYKKMNLLNYVLKGESVEYEDINDISNCYINNLKILKSIFLNVYGLTTLVINHNNLYNTLFLNEHPSDYYIIAYSKQNYLDYANKRKNLTMQLLEKEIKLYDKQLQLSKCTNDIGISKLKLVISKIELEKNRIILELDNLANNLNYQPYKVDNLKREKKNNEINNFLDTYYEHFGKAKSVEGKKKVKKIIGQLLDKKLENEKEYMFGYCNNMNEVLTIIRNSFSHIGRLNVSTKNLYDETLILNDYDNDYKKSGVVIIKYKDLMKILCTPFLEESKILKKITK